ncbi:MAG: hypothetical protein ACE5GW_02190 [Planctomycetota bacterium]
MDPQHQPRRGLAVRHAHIDAGGKGRGSARRLADLANQLDLTWDLHTMKAEELLEILPAEFDRFKDAT